MGKLGLSHFRKYSYKRIVGVENAKTVQVRKGFVPLYVGKEGKRYEVPVKYLSYPTFQALIRQSVADEREIKIEGPIVLPCKTEIFDQILKLAKEY
ncbi:hypothetical protein L1049_009002 [Liquidambar formosana]|uniref:Small auxin up regulated protein n=1 Tax=Liquidambar formosana TaxID=63359 RepID=A0AAP0SBK5_LIQFO